MKGAGVKLAAMRKSRGFKLGEVADILGISRNTLAAYEKDKVEMPISVGIKLINFYKCDIFEIYGVHTSEGVNLTPYEMIKIQAGCAVFKEMEADRKISIVSLPDEYYKRKYKSYIKRHLTHTQFHIAVSEEVINKDADELFKEMPTV